MHLLKQLFSEVAPVLQRTHDSTTCECIDCRPSSSSCLNGAGGVLPVEALDGFEDDIKKLYLSSDHEATSDRTVVCYLSGKYVLYVVPKMIVSPTLADALDAAPTSFCEKRARGELRPPFDEMTELQWIPLKDVLFGSESDFHGRWTRD